MPQLRAYHENISGTVENRLSMLTSPRITLVKWTSSESRA